jgi:Ca2+-binding EF-hand superfamily protein
MAHRSTSLRDVDEEELADLKEAFAMFDINGDGTVPATRSFFTFR